MGRGLCCAVHNFRKLAVWSRSVALGAEIYQLCAAVTRPREHLVTAQLRRSALSIASNIAEGCGKRSRAETIRYLEIASGSAAESEHHLLVAADLGILPKVRCDVLADEVVQIRRMIRTLIERFPSNGGGT